MHFDRKTIIVAVVAGVVGLVALFVVVSWLAFDVVCDYVSSQPTKAPIREKLVPFAAPFKDDTPESTKVRYGFINHDGKLVIRDQFDDAGAFHEQRAPVRSGDDWSFIDTTGRILKDSAGRPAVFSRVHEFAEGLAAARREGGKWGFIDRNCQW